jgi:hypothetical protein
MKVWGPVLEGWNVERSPWLEQIRTEGRVEMARAAVVDVLEARFPGAVPPEALEAIRRETKLPLLQQSISLAAVKSPDEVTVCFNPSQGRGQRRHNCLRG